LVYKHNRFLLFVLSEMSSSNIDYAWHFEVEVLPSIALELTF
jgi:hypothetical protein